MSRLTALSAVPLRQRFEGPERSSSRPLASMREIIASRDPRSSWFPSGWLLANPAPTRTARQRTRMWPRGL
eukprot:4226063-Pyramimonas_sp.AAC.1